MSGISLRQAAKPFNNNPLANPVANVYYIHSALIPTESIKIPYLK